MQLEENEKLNLLFDLYSNLLTDYQAKIFALYYQENLSLNEIAENENVSKNAVFLLIKRVSKILLNYEEKLHLLDKYERIYKISENSSNDDIKKIISIIEE